MIADACHSELSARAVSALITSGTRSPLTSRRQHHAGLLSDGRQSSFKDVLRRDIFLGMIRPGLQTGQPQFAESFTQGAFRHGYRKTSGDFRAQIGAAPSHDGMDCRIGAGDDDPAAPQPEPASASAPPLAVYATPARQGRTRCSDVPSCAGSGRPCPLGAQHQTATSLPGPLRSPATTGLSRHRRSSPQKYEDQPAYGPAE